MVSGVPRHSVRDPSSGRMGCGGGARAAGAHSVVKHSLAKGRDERSSGASDKVGDHQGHAADIARHDRIAADDRRLQQAMGAARRGSRDAAIELKDWNAWFSILSSDTAM